MSTARPYIEMLQEGHFNAIFMSEKQGTHRSRAGLREH